MGTFMGHALPGSFFASFALWWTYNVFLRYYACRRATTQGGAGARTPYLSTPAFTSRCMPRIPIEGCLKVAVVVIGMTGELITAFKHGRFANLGNGQHMTMYFFFGLNGFIDLLMHYRAPLPPALDYVSAALAFCMEGVLFLYHLHGRTPMDIQIHMLLVMAVGACIVSTVLEMCFRRNVLPALMRCYFTLLQGTWFFQAGFILYPPVGGKWDENNHGQMMIVTMIFCWHNAAVFMVMLFIGFIVYYQVKMHDTNGLYQIIHPFNSSLPSTSSGQSAKLDAEQMQRMILDESEEEM